MSQTLTPEKIRAIETLTTSGDISAAAKAAGRTRETLYRWLDDPDFKAALRAAEAEAMDRLSGELVVLARAATRTLAETMQDKNAAAGVRVRAAEVVLQSLLKVRELATIEQRLTALEGQK